MNELDEAERSLKNGEPLTVKRRHLQQRSLRNTPSMNTNSNAVRTSGESERQELFRLAAAEGNLQLVRSMLSTDPTLLHAADENYWQALHEAIRGGRTSVVKFLVEEGAELDWKVNNGGNALWLAKQTLASNHDIVKYLQSVGAVEDI
jgi:ankyrin repeat protein